MSERSYWVYAEGDAKGPYPIDAIVELIRRGAVRSDTPLRVDGAEDWLSAATLPEVNRHLRAIAGPVPETVVMDGATATRPLPPPGASPATSKASSKLGGNLPKLALGLGLGVFGGGLVAAAILFVPRLLESHALVPEPILEAGLPSNVQSVSVIRVGGSAFSAEEQGLRISTLAPLCGGTDIGDLLLDARGQTPAELEATGMLGLLQREGLREQLQCAQGIAAAAEGFHLVALMFEDDDQARRVALMPLGDLSAPPYPREHNFSGLNGRCHPTEEEGSADCDESRDALVRRGDWWAFGDGASIAAYAREWNRGAERSETTNMEYARVLSEGLEQNALLTGVVVRPETLPFVEMCSAVPGGVAECLPDDIDDTLTRIRTQVRGVSVQVTAPSAGAFDPELRWAMAFAARDEEDAEDVAREIEVLLQDWRAHLENNESVFVERIRESERRDKDQPEAQIRAFVRGMREAEVEIDGRVARLVAATELSEAEQREVRAYLGTVRGDREAASRVVRAIAAGEPPAQADLERLVGAEAASWMLQPRASEETCATIRARITELGQSASALEFGSQFRLNRRFGEARCEGSVMSTETRDCLTNAESLAAMEGCPLQRPPWETQPIDRSYEGVLSDDDPRIGQDGSPYDEYEVEVGAGWMLAADMQSTAFDTYLWLIGPDGSSLVQDDDGGGGTDSRFSHTTTQAGTYTVRTNSYDGMGRGPYTLRVVARPPDL